MRRMPFKLFSVLFFEKDVVTPTVTVISARSLIEDKIKPKEGPMAAEGSPRSLTPQL